LKFVIGEFFSMTLDECLKIEAQAPLQLKARTHGLFFLKRIGDGETVWRAILGASRGNAYMITLD
jgi:hypothetical protein